MKAVLKTLNERLTYINEQIGFEDRHINRARKAIENGKANLATLHSERDELVAAIDKLKAPAGPKEMALRAQREAKFERTKVPYAGKPKHGSKPETRYGLKNAKKKKL